MSNMGETRFWADSIINMVTAQLLDEPAWWISNLAPCEYRVINQLRQELDPSTASGARRIMERLGLFSDNQVKADSIMGKSVSLQLRQLYSDCRLLHSLLELQDSALHNANEQLWEHAINRLDMAIIVAGAPGVGRLDLILDTIEYIQREYLPLRSESNIFPQRSLTQDHIPIHIDTLAPNYTPRIPPPPVSTFRDIFSSSPFILSGFISDWPALTDHSWSSYSYLRQIAGRGRVVPVEIGSDYRAEEWNQKMIPWKDFLRGIGMNLDYRNSDKNEREHGTERKDVLYLAQHTLLTQFPALRSDIIVPDYVYASLPPPSTFPAYRPPGNDEQLVINAWLGPQGTVSPAHTDPYFNCYAQVVGRKTVWLAPPEFQDEMYPFSNPNLPHTTRSDSSTSMADASRSGTPSLSNTSRIDVFSPMSSNEKLFPLFNSHVYPNSLCAVLQPGDLLYIPPGWWHAMRSEDISFSVSMWF